MKVTVRTLDSKSTTFDVEDDETVKQFKEKIAPQLEIPVERQRVIFKGKVLQDEKLMKDYNVDGCVIHLVQRAPPSSTTSSSASRDTSTPGERTSADGQPNVFIGAFRGSNDMTNVTQHIVENLLSTFGGAHGAATVTTSSTGDGTAVNVQINMQAENQSSSSTSDAEQRIQQAQQFLSSARTRLRNLEMNTSSVADMEVDGEPSTQQRDAAESDAAESTSTQPPVTNSPQCMANTIKEFQDLYRQLEPSLSRYQALLSDPKSETRTASDDNLPDGIAEIFHNLSHGLHALSDLTFNFQSPEPQTVATFPRISPVNVPQFSAPSQTATSTVPTNTSSSAAQPHVHVQPHPNVFQRTRAGAANQNGQQNGTAVSSAAGAPSVGFHTTPIGVSATVIQIPRFPVPPGMQQPASTSSQATPSAPLSSSSGAPFSLSNLFSTMQQTMSTGMPRGFPPPGTFAPPGAAPNAPVSTMSTSTPGGMNTSSTYSATSSVPPSTTTQTAPPHVSTPRPFTGLPFNFNPINPNALAGHPDPLVPCQSFHFGPRFQQEGGHRHIVAEVSSVMIEHIHGGAHAPSDAAPFGDSVPRQDNPSTASGTTGPTNAPSSTSNSQSFFGGNLASNILSGIFDQGSFQQQQQQQQQQQGDRQQSTQEDQRAELQGLFGFHAHDCVDDDEGDEGDDDISEDDILGPTASSPASQLYDDVRRAAASVFTGQGDNQSIRQFVDSRFLGEGETADEPDDLFSQLVTLVAEHITLTDVMQIILGGSYRPLSGLAPHLLQFIETKFNDGNRLTSDNVSRVTENIVSRVHENSETAESLNRRPEVDFPATLRAIDSEFCKKLLLLLINRENITFVEDITSLFNRYLAVSVAVIDHCVAGGMEAYVHRCLQSESASRIISAMEPSIVEMSTTMFMNKMRASVRSSPPLTPEELQSRLVKKAQTTKKAAEVTKKRALDVRKRTEVTKKRTEVASDDDDDDDFQMASEYQEWNRPQASAMSKDERKGKKVKMDVNKRWEELNGAIKSDDDDDDQNQVTSEYQEWHRHVPPEWIAVITKDAKRQRTQPAQRPFSDAYYNGLPPKRRKAFSDAKQADRGVSLSAALQNSIAAVNAQPLTSQSDLSSDLEKKDLNDAFQDSFRKDARKRLEKDPDYKPSKFPKSQEYFFKK